MYTGLDQMASQGLPNPGFFASIAKRNSAKLNSFIDEQFEFLLEFGAISVAEVVFVCLRYWKPQWFVDTLEKMEDITALLVLALFFLRIIRRSLAGASASATEEASASATEE